MGCKRYWFSLSKTRTGVLDLRGYFPGQDLTGKATSAVNIT